MKIFNKIIKGSLLTVSSCLFFLACNKAPLPAVPLTQPTASTAPTLAKLLDDPQFSILKAAVTKAGLLPTLSVPTLKFTLFAPDDNAFIASGIPSVAAVNTFPAATLNSIISYHVIPQIIASSSIPVSFPNFEYPTILNPTGISTTPGYNPLVRLTTYPSRRANGAWVNNIPIIATDIQASNGVLHKVAALVAPPSAYLWDIINASPDLTFFKAAIQRADSGVAVAGRLQTALGSFGTNLTVLAPTDAAVQQFAVFTITTALVPVITQQLILGGYTRAQAAVQAPILAQQQAAALAASPTVFSNPLLYGPLPAQTVRGLIVYHFLGTTIPGIRIFTVNLSTAPTQIKTLLNQAVPPHPGVTVQATFTGPFVTAATAKGLANPTAANFILPADINAVNGVMHKIDQVLVPQ
ncbi:MAG: fasciclin domain-containing protein [Ferruginibacter sp.]